MGPSARNSKYGGLSQGGTKRVAYDRTRPPVYLLAGLGWWVIHAFPSLEKTRGRHAARRRRGSVAPRGARQPPMLMIGYLERRNMVREVGPTEANAVRRICAIGKVFVQEE